MKKNSKIYLWLFFIGLLISTFYVYNSTFRYGLVFASAILIVLLLKSIMHFVDFIINKSVFLSSVFNLIEIHMNNRKNNLNLELNDTKKMIDTSLLKFVNIERYNSLINTYEKIIKRLDLNDYPIVFISPNKNDCYMPFGYEETVSPVIHISEKEFNNGNGDFILGHEISHHYYKDYKNELNIIFYSFISIIILGLLLNPYLYIISSSLLLTISFLGAKFLNRRSEYRADLMASHFTNKSQGIDFFNEMRKERDYKETMISTHPSYSNRIENVIRNNIKLPELKDNNLENFGFLNILISEMIEHKD